MDHRFTKVSHKRISALVLIAFLAQTTSLPSLFAAEAYTASESNQQGVLNPNAEQQNADQIAAMQDLHDTMSGQAGGYSVADGPHHPDTVDASLFSAVNVLRPDGSIAQKKLYLKSGDNALAEIWNYNGAGQRTDVEIYSGEKGYEIKEYVKVLSENGNTVDITGYDDFGKKRSYFSYDQAETLKYKIFYADSELGTGPVQRQESMRWDYEVIGGVHRLVRWTIYSNRSAAGRAEPRQVRVSEHDGSGNVHRITTWDDETGKKATDTEYYQNGATKLEIVYNTDNFTRPYFEGEIDSMKIYNEVGFLVYEKTVLTYHPDIHPGALHWKFNGSAIYVKERIANIVPPSGLNGTYTTKIFHLRYDKPRQQEPDFFWVQDRYTTAYTDVQIMESFDNYVAGCDSNASRCTRTGASDYDPTAPYTLDSWKMLTRVGVDPNKYFEKDNNFVTVKVGKFTMQDGKMFIPYSIQNISGIPDIQIGVRVVLAIWKKGRPDGGWKGRMDLVKFENALWADPQHPGEYKFGLSGLEPGVEYECKILAYDGSHNYIGDVSPAGFKMPTLLPPSVVAAPQVTAHAPNKAKVALELSRLQVSKGQTVTVQVRYRPTVGTGATPSEWAVKEIVVDKDGKSEAVFDGLKSDTQYEYQVTLVTNEGQVFWDQPTTAFFKTEATWFQYVTAQNLTAKSYGQYGQGIVKFDLAEGNMTRFPAGKSLLVTLSYWEPTPESPYGGNAIKRFTITWNQLGSVTMEMFGLESATTYWYTITLTDPETMTKAGEFWGAQFTTHDSYSAPRADQTELLTAAIDLDTKYAYTNAYANFNWSGQLNEKWLKTKDGVDQFILPDGRIFIWLKSSGKNIMQGAKKIGWLAVGTATHVRTETRGGVQYSVNSASEVYDDLSILTKAREDLDAFWKVHEAAPISFSGKDHLNWGGKNEKWFFVGGNWAFITPDGVIKMWDGGKDLNTSKKTIGRLNPRAYRNLVAMIGVLPQRR